MNVYSKTVTISSAPEKSCSFWEKIYGWVLFSEKTTGEVSYQRKLRCVCLPGWCFYNSYFPEYLLIHKNLTFTSPVMFTAYKYSVVIDLGQVNKGNTRKIFEICSKLTIKTPEQCHWHRSGVFISWIWTYFTIVFVLLT